MGDDLIGIKPLGEAVKIVTEATTQTAAKFFDAVCLPAAQELGELFKDKVRVWRMNNINAITAKAQNLLPQGFSGKTLRPRIGLEFIENGSKEESDLVQDMWAGFLVTSLDSQEDSDLIYLSLLKNLNPSVVKLLEFAIIRSKKNQIQGLIQGQELRVDISELQKILDIECIQSIDRIVDYMNEIGVFSNSTIDVYSPGDKLQVSLQVSALGYNLYVRCKGSNLNPVEYFSLDK